MASTAASAGQDSLINTDAASIMVEDSELEASFKRVLEELHIPASRMGELLKQSKQVKWQMISTHKIFRSKFGRNGAGDAGTPSGVIAALDSFLDPSRTVIDHQEITDTRMKLGNLVASQDDFVRHFLQLGGLAKVMLLLHKVEKVSLCSPASQLAACPSIGFGKSSFDSTSSEKVALCSPLLGRE
jgi:hypothetical protein